MNVLFHPGKRPLDEEGMPQGCGNANVMYNTAKDILGAQIDIWEKQSNGTDCASSYTAVLAHEIGHVLGLDHAEDSGCEATLMYGGSLNPGARPADIHCNAVDALWVTSADPPGSIDHDHLCKWIVK